MLKKLNPKTKDLIVPLLSIILAAGIIAIKESALEGGRSAFVQGILFFLIIITNLVYLLIRLNGKEQKTA